MDLAVLIVGFIMGFVACYFTMGPGKDKMNKKDRPARVVREPRRRGTARPAKPAPKVAED